MRMILAVLAVCVVRSVFSAALPLKGVDWWAGIPRHPAVVNPAAGQDPSAVLSLRGEWEYAIGRHGNGWRNWGFQFTNDWPIAGMIQVPGCWEKQGVGERARGTAFLCQDSAEKDVRHKFNGELWYRRHVTIPAEWAGRRVWFKTGGMRSRGHVWINDHPVAMVASFCAAWKYEITDFVRPGERAKIVVVIDNDVSPRNVQLNCVNRWGGFWRDVELEATPRTFIDDAWVVGDFDGRSAAVNVEIEGGSGLITDHRLRVTIDGEAVDAEIRQSGRQKIEVPLRDFRPWSPEHPNLYGAKIELLQGSQVVQTRHERFGVRKLEVRGKEFYLNGKPFFVRAFGDDSVYPIDGLTPADRAFHAKHLQVAHRAGFNYVRTHTHAEVPEYFEAADEVGILIQPEMSYYFDNPEDDFGYDPMSDLEEICITYRRYPSFGCYSGGNEGSFGPYAGKAVAEWIKRNDPGRLYIEQDGGSYLHPGHGVGRTTHASGPLMPWRRGSFNPSRPFIAHEYLNLCVKSDSRHAKDYTGAWMPPVTRADREWWLKRHGLDMDWGDRLQTSQHALQRFWQKHGLESARMDPYCDGYCFWTIVDVVVWNAASETYSAQGLFDPFWRQKDGGSSADEFSAFNSSSCVLWDNTGRGDRPFVENRDRSLCNSPWAIEPCHEGIDRVYVSGESIPADFLFAHYGEAPVLDAKIVWKILTGERTLLAGERNVGDQGLGSVRLLVREQLKVPELDSACRAELVATVSGSMEGRGFERSNSWAIWLFPRRATADGSAIACDAAYLGLLSSRYRNLKTTVERRDAKVVILPDGTPAVSEAMAEGKNVIALANQTGAPNCALGWWRIGAQCGTAIRPHRALSCLPYEPNLTPLLFRIIKEGTKLRFIRNIGTDIPVCSNFKPSEVIIAGEGGTECYSYLAETSSPNGVRCFHVSGLDVLSDTPEGTALLDGLLVDLQR